jgi:anti-sigma-K factor RskA
MDLDRNRKLIIAALAAAGSLQTVYRLTAAKLFAALPLGVLPADGLAQIVIPPAFADQARRDAVSLEPPGGSPTGQPTGPVIGSGKLTNL